MIHVTAHAVQRAMERIPGVKTEDQARAALRSRAVLAAAEFGAHVVRLATGQRIIIEDHTVVTVLPDQNYRRTVRRVGRGRFG